MASGLRGELQSLRSRKRNRKKVLTNKDLAAYKNLFRLACLAYIDEAINATLQETGMSRAAWLPAASDLSRRTRDPKKKDLVTQIKAAINGRPPKRPNITAEMISGHPVPQSNIGRKSISKGQQIGEQSYTLRTDGEKYDFQFSLKVLQSYLNETGQTNTKASQNSLEPAKQAFRDYIRQHAAEAAADLTKILLGNRRV